MARRAPGLLLLGLACALTAAHRPDARGPAGRQLGTESVALVQGQVHLHGGRRLEAGPGDDLGSQGPAVADASPAEPGRPRLFEKAIVLTIDGQKYAEARERLGAQGVATEPFWGFNGRMPEELDKALAFLQELNLTRVPRMWNNFIFCAHMAPGTKPVIRKHLHVLARDLYNGHYRTIDDMLEHDVDHCMNKTLSAVASHLHLWQGLADGSLASPSVGDEEDPWYLILENDASLCPGWRQRMEAEMPLLPSDAGLVQLHWFGHWRRKDQLADGSPFLQARDVFKLPDMIKSGLYELISGVPLEQVPMSPFYLSAQAYMVKRSSVRELLSGIRGMGFTDVDVLMHYTKVKSYVWRRVLTEPVQDHHDTRGEAARLSQMSPVCNTEPGRDWW